MSTTIPTRVVASATPAELSPRQVRAEFEQLLRDGAIWRVAGRAKRDPRMLLRRGYVPRYETELFGTRFYLCEPRQNPDIRFFVAYVVQRDASGRRTYVYPRIFYKDVSLVWRSASHFLRSEVENWIGKGDVREGMEDGHKMVYSAEETTDLPLELQSVLEALNHAARRIVTDDVAIELVLRRGPDDRLEPYRDFTWPRRRAAANRRNLVNGGRRVAWFEHRNDPRSLRFARGFEPDFDHGVLETYESTSSLYGGPLHRFRILSRNRKIQYLFFAGPRQVWIIPPQALTTELSSYGVRTIDVLADEDLCVPGYEYHYLDETEDPPVFVSQIPPGFAGEVSEVDSARADASPWLDALPVVREFRRKILARSVARVAARKAAPRKRHPTKRPAC